MTKPIRATESGLQPFFKVRVAVGSGFVMHLASWDEPKITEHPSGVGLLKVEARWINSPEYGDTVGYIDWTTVTAISWRWAP